MRSKKYILLFAFLALIVSYLTTINIEFLYAFSALAFCALGGYLMLFHLNVFFEFIVVLTPFSLNLEDMDLGGIGFYLPTEPMLFGMLVLLALREFSSSRLEPKLIAHPVSLAILFYLAWILITSITSVNIVVSLKFFISKLWFLIPIYFFGVGYFKKKENIYRFFWLYFVSMSVVILYTLVVHASYGFGEDPSHWAMRPFFKDHTVYGAVLALVFPVIIGLFLLEKKAKLKLLKGFVVVLYFIGIIFSYTRAAYLSLVLALLVLIIIKLKIKFVYLAFIAFVAIGYVVINGSDIIMELQKNKAEHTEEDFGDRLHSISNISTDASNVERINRWSCAIEMFKEKPLAGFGPGTYAMEYAPYQHPDNKTIISTNFGTGGNAHSEYLGALAESGIFGLISILVLVSTLLWYGVVLSVRLVDSELKIIAVSCTLGLITYFAHGFLNNYLDTDKVSVPLWGFCAILVAIGTFHEPGTSKK